MLFENLTDLEVILALLDVVMQMITSVCHCLSVSHRIPAIAVLYLIDSQIVEL